MDNNFESIITDQAFWYNKDNSEIPRNQQVQILSELDADYNSLPTKSKHEVIDTYKGKVKPYDTISTDEGGTEPSSWTSEIPQIAGGIIGGLADKTVAGRILKSGVLGGGGEAYKQIYQHATGSKDAPKTSIEANNRIAEAMLAQGGGQAIGEGLTRGASKIIPKIRPEYLETGLAEPTEKLRQYMIPYQEQGGLIRRILKLSPKEKSVFTLGQQADPLSSVVKFETIIENSLTGAQPIQELKRVQEKAIQDYAKDTVKNIWGAVSSATPSEQGTILTNLLKENISNFHKEGKILYDAVDFASRGSNVKVDLNPLLNTVKEFSKAMEVRRGIGSSEVGDAFIKKASTLNDSMSFGEAQELKSGLLAEQRRLEKGEKAYFVISKLVESLDTQMEKAAKNISADVYKLWRNADTFWKAGKDQYENDFVKGLLDIAIKNKQPELIGKQIFQNTEVGQINIVKKALGFNGNNWSNEAGKNAFQSIKAGWFEELVGKATKLNTGEIEQTTMGNTINNALRSMGGKAKNWWDGEAIKAMFNPQEIKVIQNFETATRISQRAVKSSGGAMLIQLIQAGSIMSVGAGLIGQVPGFENNQYSDEMIISGIAALATPRIFGKMLVNPKYQKLFIQGLDVNKPITWPILSKLITGAIETERTETRIANKSQVKPNEQNKYIQNKTMMIE